MPKPTFFNLQHEKQKNIINASKSEFSKYGFYEASINRIIKDAGIARGSFYQYFDNKEDLFLYLLDETRQFLISEISKKIKGKKCDFFELHLLIFDEITSDDIIKEEKEFIITTIANINIKLIHHLLKFLDPKDFNDEMNNIQEILSFDNLKLTSIEEIINLHSILTNVMISQLVVFFGNMDTQVNCRKNLLNQFQLIKYGVLNSKI